VGGLGQSRPTANSRGGFVLGASVEWTRSNRHTGNRHLPLRLQRGTG
jgi:hypothetical protein